MSDPAFEANQVSVSYGGVRALVDFTLRVNDGQLAGLIGPNGAGKTTFIDAATGFARATGSIRLGGTEIAGLSPDKRARLGLGRTWQSTELFDDLSVQENLTVTQRPARRRKQLSAADDLAHAELVEGAIALLDLAPLLTRSPIDLSAGQRKLVGVARALAASPKLVLLDEPAAGLDAYESQELGKHLRQVVGGGVPMLLIDHDMGLVLNVCDYVYVLDFGHLIAEGTPQQIRVNPTVIDAYLGRSAVDLENPSELGQP